LKSSKMIIARKISSLCRFLSNC